MNFSSVFFHTLFKKNIKRHIAVFSLHLIYSNPSKPYIKLTGGKSEHSFFPTIIHPPSMDHVVTLELVYFLTKFFILFRTLMQCHQKMSGL